MYRRLIWASVEAGAPHFVTLSPVRTGIFDRVASLMVMRKEGKFGVNLPS
jgi:hypothetical protein